MKRKRQWKQFIRIIGAFLIAVMTVLPVFGMPRIDTDQSCSLTIRAVHEKTVLSGMSFSLYRAADVDETGKFTLCGSFVSCGEEVNGLSDAREWKEKAKKLEDWTRRTGTEPMARTQAGSDGTAVFRDLRAGLYLVGGSQVTIDEKEYKSEAFLISLPNESVNQENWIYAVTVEAKTEVPETPTVPQTSEPATEPTKPSPTEPTIEPTSPVTPTRHTSGGGDSDDDWEPETKMKAWETKQDTAAESTAAQGSDAPEAEREQDSTAEFPEPDQENNADVAGKLPQTGQLKWPVPVLMICGLILMAGMVFVKRKELKKAVGVFGVICLAGALGLQCFNSMEERKADRLAADALVKLEQVIGENEASDLADGLDGTAEIAGTNTGVEKETGLQADASVQIDGDEYLGYLTVPDLGLSLPVMEDWSYPKLRRSPCRYSGSLTEGGLVIAAHNYKRHFYGISSLKAGDPVTFTDAAGNVCQYQVVRTELLDPEDVSEMKDPSWDLTLFTCTYGGKQRITVRCVKADGEADMKTGNSPDEKALAISEK